MSPANRINVTGNQMHFTGFGYPRGWLEPCTSYTEHDEVFSVSGAAFAISRNLFCQVGGFDEIFYPAYLEDIDLSWRLRLMGYKCGYVSSSVVYHDYTPTFNIDKFYMLETHRQQMLIKNYRWRTLLLLLPAIVLGEIVAWGYALASSKAHIYAKAKSYGWLLRKWRHVMKAKRATQRLRVVSDRDIVKQCAYKLAYEQAGSGIAVKIGKWVIDPLFFALYHISLFLLRW
jgi:hypothetical protein